jgi:hypothetical protein
MTYKPSLLRSLSLGLLLAATTVEVGAQVPLESQKTPAQEGAQPPAKGGSITAGVFPPTYDGRQRPITVGGTVKTGPIIFQNIAKQAGLTVWQHKMGSPDKKTIVDTIGSGVALLDFDNDGWLDIYLVNGSTEDALDGKAPAPHAALFHNNHDIHRRHRQGRCLQRPLGLRRRHRRLRQRWMARYLRQQPR